jgi:hypothetical protein
MIPVAASGDTTAYHVTGETLFASIPAAAEASKGIIELATVEEANLGADTERAVTPAGLLLKKDSGLAIVGGDLTGSGRGDGALDIQASHSVTSQVASGDYATAVGVNNKASGNNSTAVGLANSASGVDSAALGDGNSAGGQNATALGSENAASGAMATAAGYDNTASGQNSTALGYASQATAAGATAIGNGAEARIEKTTNICGPVITRKDNGETTGLEFESYPGAQVILMTKEISLKSTSQNTITLPAGCHFYTDEAGIIITAASGVNTRPTVSMGWSGNTTGLASAFQISANSQFKRSVASTIKNKDGQTTLVGAVTVAASATLMKGRFYFRGILLEDE